MARSGLANAPGASPSSETSVNWSMPGSMRVPAGIPSVAVTTVTVPATNVDCSELFERRIAKTTTPAATARPSAMNKASLLLPWIIVIGFVS